MEHTQIVSATLLEEFANTRMSEDVIPELVWQLVGVSVTDLSLCRIPYGDSVNQPGLDGLTETANGFRQFVPKGRTFWEIGTGKDPQDKATADFGKRTGEIPPDVRKEAAFVFVTPRGAGSGGWDEPTQRTWLGKRADSGWREIKILDGVQIADWLRGFPAIGKWFLNRFDRATNASGFSTPAEHWENLESLHEADDPPLPAKVFLVNREKACMELGRLLRGETIQMVLQIESEGDAEDFVAAYLASLDPGPQGSSKSRCLFVNEADAWYAMAGLRSSHVLVAGSALALESSGEQLHLAARKNGHAVVIPSSGSLTGWGNAGIHLRSPSASLLEATLREGGYSSERARKLAGAGAQSLASLKRYLRGLGDRPPYVTWEGARLLALAGLVGQWVGGNPADAASVEAVLGESYGEWIEKMRPETLRSDTPLIQRNDNWRVISRAETWAALGPQLSNQDLDRFQETALRVLGERDLALELKPDERFAAAIHGKALQHSPSLRKGIAETLALLGSKPESLISCSQGKAELVSTLVVRGLLSKTDWVAWASLDRLLPLLAESSPDAFLSAVEAALEDLSQSPFKDLFAQESSAGMGGTYLSGLLWALEALAWSSDYLSRVTVLLGDLASIDPGGNWANRPANSLTNIFLPWYPQTCATIPKRRAAVQTVLRNHPAVGWKLLMALLPRTGGVSMGSYKPTWRDFVPSQWSEGTTRTEYWEQVEGYAELAVGTAAADLPRLAELIERLPDLPDSLHSCVLDHLSSGAVTGLSEPDRLPLWEALTDLAARHRAYSDADWAMPKESVSRIAEVASQIAPTTASLLHRRLFSARDMDLFAEKGNYDEQAGCLAQQRQQAVEEMLAAEQLPAILDFARQVASPEKVGEALGRIRSAEVETALLPGCLDDGDRPLFVFISGFVWARFQGGGWDWVSAVKSADWTIDQRANFVVLLPFEEKAWNLAESLLGDHVSAYWGRVRVPFGPPKEHLEEASEKFLFYGRPFAALACLERLLGERPTFAPDLAVRVLKACATTDLGNQVLDVHAVRDLIEWLQANPDTPIDDLLQIEFAYLQLLDHESGGGMPKALEQRMASTPAFFCEVLALVFRSDMEGPLDIPPSDEKKRVAQNVFHLLYGWRTVPGTNADGSFDSAAFCSWLAEVKRQARETGYFEVAMSQVGQVLPYAPGDPDGLWIHRAVAMALDSKDATGMREGFAQKRFNMRGIVRSPRFGNGGREERALAARYREQAEALDLAGYTRFAATMRGLADGYEQEAKQEEEGEADRE